MGVAIFQGSRLEGSHCRIIFIPHRPVSGFKKPVLAANSSNIQFPNYNEPLQIHFSLAKNATEMVMTFVTLNSSSPEVKWGTVSGHLDNVEKVRYMMICARILLL